MPIHNFPVMNCSGLIKNMVPMSLLCQNRFLCVTVRYEIKPTLWTNRNTCVDWCLYLDTLRLMWLTPLKRPANGS